MRLPGGCSSQGAAAVRRPARAPSTEAPGAGPRRSGRRRAQGCRGRRWTSAARRSPRRPARRPAAARTPPRRLRRRSAGPSGSLAFGQTYVWDNGLAVTAGRPAELAVTDDDLDQEEGPQEGGDPTAGSPPPQTATEPASAPASARPGAGTSGTEAVGTGAGALARTSSTAPPATGVLTVDVVILNGTDEPVNTSVFVAMTSGGADAPPVYDPDAGLTGPPGTMLQPGGTARFTMGFEVEDPADLTMEVRPAYHYVPALFVRPAGAQG
ncbi:hypothetical protein [Georgenia sp. SUBG003]|uniref:hypothetical protein n=1 Tax=Georgenia sp. SUBG003 TaxID=1497974 RepID=UPI003AB44404